MKSKLVPALLILNAVAFFFFAAKWFFQTKTMAGELGIALTNADAVTDAQAVYAGLELGVGVFLVVCALKPSLHQAGILAAACTLAGLGLCRGLGILTSDTAVTKATWKLLSTDLLGAVINTAACVWAWRRRAVTT